MNVLTPILILVILATASSKFCNTRSYEYGTVCVCNATYCDKTPKLEICKNKYQLISTSKTKMGFTSTTGELSKKTNKTPHVSIDVNEKYQKVMGFGGAFTDAAGININSLPEGAQKNLLESYFGEDGNEYNLCRVPVGGTDYSTRAYTYDDDVTDDVKLKHFKLQPEDLQHKIPNIQKALKLRKGNLKLFGSAWTAPPWMKTNNDYSGVGVLKEKYYQLWADYHIRFLEEYQKHNVSFWGLTTGNEPLNGFIPHYILSVSAMGWTPSQANDWIGNNFGPTIRNSEFNSTKIILFDDNRISLLALPWLLNNSKTLKYADGVGIHWYLDTVFPPVFLDLAKTPKKDLFLLATEACNGPPFLTHPLAVQLGSWDRAVKYVDDILEDFNYGVQGWLDWNLALNTTGGPTYAHNEVDASIIVNSTAEEFYKQPMFYALGHFSKFILPDSIRLKTNLRLGLSEVSAMGFERPDGRTAVIIQNKRNRAVDLTVGDGASTATVQVQGNSINTLVF